MNDLGLRGFQGEKLRAQGFGACLGPKSKILSS